jgi:hypothetical protein
LELLSFDQRVKGQKMFEIGKIYRALNGRDMLYNPVAYLPDHNMLTMRVWQSGYSHNVAELTYRTSEWHAMADINNWFYKVYEQPTYVLERNLNILKKVFRKEGEKDATIFEK